MNTEFFIGRYDLDFLDDFYPDDLPSEWRFDYYANMFNALLLPLETAEDIESILEELDENFWLVFEIKPEQPQNSERLNEVLALITKGQNIVFWLKVTAVPHQQTLDLLHNRAVAFQSKKPIQGLPADYKHHYVNQVHIYYNHTPVIVSSLLLSDEQISKFLKDIVKTKQKTIIICRSAESTSLEKVRLIANMLGY